MNQAGSGGHPLGVAGSDDAAAAAAVAMSDAALIENGDGLKAAMGVGADAAFVRGGGGELVGSGVVQQQEGRDRFGDIAVGENVAHREAVADPVAPVAAFDEIEFFHVVSSSCCFESNGAHMFNIVCAPTPASFSCGARAQNGVDKVVWGEERWLGWAHAAQTTP
ncbi:hypothetical protein MAIT1_03703 [Magnetofaba australis IT-1]|uniref:Uncharacterized protein n=1 Tax=Magnetofaba australis IT-1 TaxID=1434232 RepID=A0A1Y2K3Y0_9PROT|nr:hypothetical protein MAIT1_03703 [Magnetofaba australis IT-1]